MQHEIELTVPNYNGTFLVQYEDKAGQQICLASIDDVTYDGLTLDIASIPKIVSSKIDKAIRADITNREEFIAAIKTIPVTAGMFHLGLSRLADGRRITNDKIRKTVFDMQKQISEAPASMLNAIGQAAYDYFTGYNL